MYQKRLILEEGHKSHFSMYPSMTKMYKDLKEVFLWSFMKWDVAQFVGACLTHQKEKSGASKTWWDVAIVGDPKMEIG